MNNTESVTEDESVRPPPNKKSKVYKQKYNCLWEKDILLRTWIAPVRHDPYKAFCKVCGKELIAGLSELKKHSKSKKHQECRYQNETNNRNDCFRHYS